MFFVSSSTSGWKAVIDMNYASNRTGSKILTSGTFSGTFI